MDKTKLYIVNDNEGFDIFEVMMEHGCEIGPGYQMRLEEIVMEAVGDVSNFLSSNIHPNSRELFIDEFIKQFDGFAAMIVSNHLEMAREVIKDMTNDLDAEKQLDQMEDKSKIINRINDLEKEIKSLKEEVGN